MCATLLTRNAIFKVTQKRKLKLTQNDVHNGSFQKYQGTITGSPMQSNANSGM